MMAALMSMGMMADDFKWLDYIHVAEPVNIRNIDRIYLYPVDASKVEWPDKTDNKYPALEQSLKAFPDIIAKTLKKKVRGVNVIIVNSIEDAQMDDKALALSLRFDELDMGELSARIWVGAGAGAQRITLAGVCYDKDKNEVFDFHHRRLGIIGRSYKKDLQIELNNYANDIAKILNELRKK